MYAEAPQINTGINFVDNAANPILSTQTALPGASANPMQIWAFTGSMIWLAGIAVLLIYSLVSLLRLRSKLVGAVKLRDNIYLADHITSPFVMGVIHPKIYLPSTLSEREQDYIILHEMIFWWDFLECRKAAPSLIFLIRPRLLFRLLSISI
ncbi:MAG TPA: hypothetical protein DCZ10_10340 [Pelotomaculum sp.]|nr:hypothetical protein [Pelotomaculum sp.]